MFCEVECQVVRSSLISNAGRTLLVLDFDATTATTLVVRDCVTLCPPFYFFVPYDVSFVE